MGTLSWGTTISLPYNEAFVWMWCEITVTADLDSQSSSLSHWKKFVSSFSFWFKVMKSESNFQILKKYFGFGGKHTWFGFQASIMTWRLTIYFLSLGSSLSRLNENRFKYPDYGLEVWSTKGSTKGSAKGSAKKNVWHIINIRITKNHCDSITVMSSVSHIVSPNLFRQCCSQKSLKIA